MSPNFHAKKTLIAGVLLGQSLLLAPLAVLADSDVRVAGQTAFSIPAGATSLNSDVVQNNLDNALVAAKDRSPQAVNIVYAKGVPVVTVGGYQVATIDSASAQSAGMSPAALAGKWADGLKAALQDQNGVNSYVAQLSGAQSAAAASGAPQAAPPSYGQPPASGYQPVQYSPGGSNYAQTPPPSYGQPPYGQPPYGQPPYGAEQPAPGQPPYGAPGGFRQGRVAYAPAGLVIPLSLQTSISTQAAKSGDMVQAQITQPVSLGDATIPAGSLVIGTISEAEAGRRLSRSGSLTIQFNRLRTPDGVETPITGHLIGGIGKYKEKDGSQEIHGEGGTAKLGQGLIRTGAGAGLGAALGTAVGAIAGRGYGAGMGAWSGAAIGGGLGASDMLLRKGRDITIPSGTAMQLQLDAPATIAGGGYTGNL
jgi:hypothetical protein